MKIQKQLRRYHFTMNWICKKQSHTIARFHLKIFPVCISSSEYYTELIEAFEDLKASQMSTPLNIESIVMEKEKALSDLVKTREKIQDMKLKMASMKDHHSKQLADNSELMKLKKWVNFWIALKLLIESYLCRNTEVALREKCFGKRVRISKFTNKKQSLLSSIKKIEKENHDNENIENFELPTIATRQEPGLYFTQAVESSVESTESQTANMNAPGDGGGDPSSRTTQ